MAVRPSAPVHAETTRQLVSMLCRNALTAHWINTLVSATLAAAVILEGRVDWRVAATWLAVVVLIDFVAGAHARAFVRAEHGIEDNARALRLYGIYATLMALGWAVAVPLFLAGASEALRFFACLLIAGMVAGAVPVMVGAAPFIQLFAVILLGTLVTFLLATVRAPTDLLLAAAALLFAAAILVSARRYNGALLTSWRLGIERAELLASMRAAHADAERACRAKSEFLANMSHEVRTPLNAIIGSVDLVMAEPVAAEARSHLAAARRSASALLQILNDVLDMEKIEAGKLAVESTPFVLAAALDEVAGVYGAQAKAKHLELAVELAPGLPRVVVGDPLRLYQVLANLLANAVKFTSEGRIVLSSRVESAREGEALLCFSVRDTGIGIPADKRTEVFQSFAQADSATTRAYGGSGLGLSIAQRLVTLMGGQRIALDSAPGLGSCFSFVLPFGVLAEPPAVPAKLPARRVPRRAGRLRVLLVDDDADNRRIMSAQLARGGFDCIEAADGVRALETGARAPAIDAIILDMHMPGMDGLEVTSRVRQREARLGLPRLPIIMLTASIRPEAREASLAAGADHHLLKPVDMAALMALLERIAQTREVGR